MVPMLSAAALLLKLLQGPVSQIIDRHVADRQTRDKLTAELQHSLLEHLSKEQETGASVIIAESKSEHWLTASWRPLAGEDRRPVAGRPAAMIPLSPWVRRNGAEQQPARGSLAKDPSLRHPKRFQIS